jgi:2-polyprenyl-3-methyl-5-hydroxy-6-metoxy-1,4-benzoquinol methylase
MKKGEKTTIAQFDQDVIKNGGYLYSNYPQKSSIFANNRLTEITLELLNFKNKKIIDVGCGDGIYTNILKEKGKLKLIVGTDASKQAILKAKKNFSTKDKKIIFKNESCYKISYSDNFFDIAIARGLLHHLETPQSAIKEMTRVANQTFIIEPNGYNKILKIIEKFSSYHQKHQEKSYLPTDLKKWISITGFKIEKENYFGLVPFFCPDFLATILKKIEPIIEKTFLNKYLCAVCVIKASKIND